MIPIPSFRQVSVSLEAASCCEYCDLSSRVGYEPAMQNVGDFDLEQDLWHC